MGTYRRGGLNAPPTLSYLTLAATLSLIGCASPGPPRAPSLHLPQPVRNLTATRIGNTVELHFTPPSNSTDKLPLRGPSVSGQLCRQLPHQPCTPVSSRIFIPVPKPSDINSFITWTDTLPASLIDAPRQLLTYRVEFFSPADRSAGLSNEAFTASGPPPAPVENLHAQGSRQGIILQWTSSSNPGDVVLRREDLAPAKPKHAGQTASKPAAAPPAVWLQTNDSKDVHGLTLDTAALPGTPYRYTAQRRDKFQLANHTLELRSDLSPPIDFTLVQIYPPPAPTGLTAAGYFSGTPSMFAIDLIWQPIDAVGLITPLTGYNLCRQPLNAAGQPAAPCLQLNNLPVPQPSFRDAAASPSETYRYSVTAIDAMGNQSPAIQVVVSPSTAP